jgi:chromosome segregation ATPase
VNLVDEAAAELYAADPDAFMDRRRELTAAARKQSDAAAAKEIAALRKPTRSAWTLNALARAEPGMIDKLAELGDQLRGAEQRLDGAAMRSLSQQRRELVDEATRRAFATTSQDAPSAAMREEVNATLLAAVANPDVADQLAAGRLTRAAQWDGFGFGAGPVAAPARPGLTVVPPPKPTPPKPREPTAAQRLQRERVAAAEKEVAAARRQLVKAEAAAAKQQQRLQALEDQLSAVRRELTEAGHQVREAKAELRRVEQKLERAGH